MARNVRQNYVFISGVIFVLIAIIHLIRVIKDWSFNLGPMEFPIGFSWVGMIIAAAMFIWAVIVALKSDQS